MKKVAWLNGLIVLLTTTAGCQTPRHVSVQVVGEDRSPIPEATVNVRFLGQGHRDEETKSGLSDESGRFEAHGVPKLTIFVYADKEGYYRTITEDMSRKEDHDVTLVLREKKNPIPLYAKKFRGKLPGLSREYGFDLQAGDWVAPHGSGEKTDLLFLAEVITSPEGHLGGRLTVRFPSSEEGAFVVNPESGYLPHSKMNLPGRAPESGYVPEITRTEFGYENLGKPVHTGYFFRTRKKEVSAGKVVYHYSKFLDGIDFYMGGGRFIEEVRRKKFPVESASVDFIYYFNPTLNDRNLEFDLSKNLTEGLKSTERVHDP